MTSLRCALAALVVLLGVLGAAAVAPAATADPGGDTDAQLATASTTDDASRDDALALVAGGAGLLILVSIAGGAWRSHRDPRAAALGH